MVLLNCLDPDGGVSSVTPEEVQAGHRAAEVLLRHGHRRLGLLVPAVTAQPAAGRGRPAGGLRGRRDGAAAVGRRPRHRRQARAARALLLGPDRPTALVCTHERLAVGAALVAAELGLAVPAALSLVSLEDGERLAAEPDPPTTTVHRPDGAMAEHAVSLLLERLAGDAAEVRQLLFGCPLRERASVAGPGRRPGTAASPR